MHRGNLISYDQANDTLLCKNTKIHLISTNITLLLCYLQLHSANFQQPEELLVKIDLVNCKQELS